MAFAEVIGVSSIAPFIALVGDATIISENNLLSQLYEFSDLTKPKDFILWLGISVLGLLTVGTSISILTFWRLSLFSQETGMEIGNRLFNYYIYQPCLFHASESSAKLTKQITIEASRVTSGIISPLMQLNARMVMAISMSTAIYIYNPTVMMTALVIFGFAYFVLYKLVKVKLTQLGQNISHAYWQRFKIMSDGLGGGIKDVLLLGRQKGFTEPFESNGKKLSYSVGTNDALIQVPRYFMELVAYGTVIFLILYLNKSSDGNLNSVLPILAVYSMAGLKLLPIF
jgi:HlyD family secretion protein